MSVYRRLEALLAEECVVLDGAVGTELANEHLGFEYPFTAASVTWAIYDWTSRVCEVHWQYATAGCDVISTNTWGLLGVSRTRRGRRPGRTGMPAWTVAARDAVALARRAVSEAGRSNECAVAFSLNDADPLLVGERPLLELLWKIDPPDLVLVETLPSVPGPSLLRALREIIAAGMPVWVSFRRTGPGFGEQPREFARAIAELGAIGVRALLVNCVPIDRVGSAAAELAACTSLPVGCYPRLDEDIDPASYADLALRWYQDGARIVGGCCGVGPAHIGAVRERLREGVTTS